MIFRIEVEQEEDGRWLAEVLELPGAMAYGPSREEAVAHAKALALRAMAERLEQGGPRCEGSWRGVDSSQSSSTLGGKPA